MNQVIYVFFLQVLLTKQMLLINPSRSLLLIIPQAAWVGTSTPPLRNPNFYTWYEVESYTSDTPWQKKLINDIITFITGHTCILQTRNKTKTRCPISSSMATINFKLCQIYWDDKRIWYVTLSWLSHGLYTIYRADTKWGLNLISQVLQELLPSNFARNIFFF